LTYQSVETSLRSAAISLDQIAARREKLIKESRDIISLSSKTIISIHTSRLKEAKKMLGEARVRLQNLRKVAGNDLLRYLLSSEQEFVESNVMMSIVFGKEIPSLEVLKVTPSSYILGLLDAVGELKRAVYDKIRQNDLQGAEERFRAMENLYVMLSPFAVYDNIVQGVRRKLDVARILIEDTRATITEESRRSEFMQTVTDLSAKLGTSSFLPEKSPPRKRDASSSEKNREHKHEESIEKMGFESLETEVDSEKKVAPETIGKETEEL
jgi:translin